MNASKLIGSVSHGTMRNEDLIPCFVDLLSDLNEERSLEWQKHFANELEATKEFARLDKILGQIEQRQNADDYYESEESSWDIETLFDEIGNFALPYFYFGAHEGDGCDYGFWLSSDFQQQIIDDGGKVVSDLSEADDVDGGEILVVNDHGNCTLYVADGEKRTEVWAIV